MDTLNGEREREVKTERDRDRETQREVGYWELTLGSESVVG